MCALVRNDVAATLSRCTRVPEIPNHVILSEHSDAREARDIPSLSAAFQACLRHSKLAWRVEGSDIPVVWVFKSFDSGFAFAQNDTILGCTGKEENGILPSAIILL